MVLKKPLNRDNNTYTFSACKQILTSTHLSHSYGEGNQPLFQYNRGKASTHGMLF